MTKSQFDSILEKDKVWNRLKKYVYILTGLVVFLIILLAVMITIQGVTLQKIINHTSTLQT